MSWFDWEMSAEDVLRAYRYFSNILLVYYCVFVTHYFFPLINFLL